jgi:diguanylate cyclase (GGDEF)-like protein
MPSSARHLEDLRREASAVARGMHGGEQALVAALDVLEAQNERFAAAGGDAEEARRLGSELRVLMSVSCAVAGTHSLIELAEIAAEAARTALDAATVAVSRWEAEAEILRTLVNVGELGPEEKRLPTDEVYRLAGDDSLRRLLEGHSYVGVVDDPHLHPLERRLLEQLGKRSCLAVPIMVGDVAWGELWASRDHGRPDFEDSDLRLLQAIAGQLAVGVGRAELFGRMADLALQDELTGLANRHALEERLELSMEGIAQGRALSLLLCDVDKLKDLSDVHGHHGGDWALRAVAAALKDAAAGVPRALVCRLSGDEFSVLADGVDQEEVRRLAEAAIARLGGHRPPIGLSCGIASTGLEVQRPADLLRVADAALYAAKRSGRGRVCLADTDPNAAWRAAGRPGARRARRDGLDIDPGALLRQGLALLDGALGGAAPLERLEGLATTFGAALSASAAAVSMCPHGADSIETMFTLDVRSGRSSSVRFGVYGDRYRLTEFPRTAELLVSGGSMHLYADDPAADAAERALLTEGSMSDVLAAAAADGRGSWLLEIYGDIESADLRLAEAALRLLTAQAVRPAGGLRTERRPGLRTIA